MAQDIQAFAVTIPAGTPASAPVYTAIPFAARVPESVVIRFPPGPGGLVGVQLTISGNAVIPSQLGGWLIGDDEDMPWDLQGYPDSGAWQLLGYNTGLYDHTIYVRWGLNTIGAGQAAAISPIPSSLLSGVLAPTL